MTILVGYLQPVLVKMKKYGEGAYFLEVVSVASHFCMGNHCFSNSNAVLHCNRGFKWF